MNYWEMMKEVGIRWVLSPQTFYPPKRNMFESYFCPIRFKILSKYIFVFRSTTVNKNELKGPFDKLQLLVLSILNVGIISCEIC
jgi:hypothetical protein